MEELKILIQKGIVYEDEFIDMYMKVIRDEGFISYFEDKREEAKTFLNTLIRESREHKLILENIKNIL